MSRDEARTLGRIAHVVENGEMWGTFMPIGDSLPVVEVELGFRVADDLVGYAQLREWEWA